MFTRCLVLSILALALALPVMADNPGQGAYDPIPTDLYISPNNNNLAIPSGDINIVPGIKGTTAVASNTAAVPADTTNMLGCGGIGQGEYTSAVYNMPESFNKFQQDASSLLSKQLLTMNFALPQTAALFDQLNNYGNQKYQSFQQGCSVDALKQDAKKQYLDACVAKLTPARVTILKNGPDGNPLPADQVPKEPFLSSMAYAQAWEVCTNQYVSDTTAFAMRKDMNQAFATQVRQLENVTNAITPLLCPAKKAADGSAVPPEENGCWQTLLIPQVRLCLDDTLGCDDAKGYTINEPLLTMPRLFDTLRYLMDDVVVARPVTNFTQQLMKVDASTRGSAANEATVYMSNATLVRAAVGTSSTTTHAVGNMANVAPKASVEEFQISYLNCKQPDILAPLKVYVAKINERTKAADASATPLTLTAVADSDYQRTITDLGLTDAADTNQLTALRMLAWTSLGCTANQTVPIFNPNITASLEMCEPQDRSDFYAMAGYDVAMSATRDIYRYLNLNLKRTYTRLLTQSAVPTSATTPTAGAAGTVTPTLSPELNARLARVVKEVMIPQVESQIERLDELNKTRGQFAQRVQQIYTAKVGCISNPGTNAMPGGGSTGSWLPN